LLITESVESEAEETVTDPFTASVDLSSLMTVSSSAMFTGSADPSVLISVSPSVPFTGSVAPSLLVTESVESKAEVTITDPFTPPLQQQSTTTTV
jgi:hypothetical protein